MNGGRLRSWFQGIRPQLYLVQLISLTISMVVGLVSVREIQRFSTDRINMHADVTFNQTVGSIQSILDSLTTTTYSFAYTHLAQQLLHMRGDTAGAREVYDSVMSNVRFIINTNRNVVDIALIDTSGKCYLFGEQIDHILADYALDYIRGMTEDSLKQGVFTGFLDEGVYRNKDSIVYIYPVYSSKQGEDNGKRIGTCLMLCRTSSITGVIRSSLFGNNVVSLVDGSGNSLVKMGETGENARLVAQEGHTFASTNWVLEQAVYEPSGEISRRIYQNTAIVFMATAFFLIFAVIVQVQRSISRPIVQINRQLQRVSAAPEEGMRIEITSQNELSAIAEGINAMLERLQTEYSRNIENQRHLLEVELSKNKLQLSALQSQINPHFLYNTLACIRGMALESDLPQIAGIASNMAAIFRYSIKGDAFVHFREEVMITRRYLDIMNLRMGNRFRVSIDIPEELMDTWMVKMMLQPLVENAVFHGIECREGDGELRIRAEYLDETRYVLTIRDNGVGIAPDALLTLNKRLRIASDSGAMEPSYKEMGIGMANINRKIKLLVGEDYGLYVESEQDVFTAVHVTMPILTRQPDG